MMELPKIKNIAQLLSTYVGQENCITDLETSRLTATGENYGSQMLLLKIRAEDKLHEFVAKIPPPGEFMQRMFNIQVTFRNEVDFYQTIIPKFEKFLTEKSLHGYLDCFPKFFGARLTLDEQSDRVDDDAVIFLENLKIDGYEMRDRTVGFDYETSKIVIKALARYHSVPMALKLQKPEVFKKIRALFGPYKVFEFDDASCELMVERFRKMIDDIPSCRQYSQRVVDSIRPALHPIKNDPKLVREPFATIIHTDAWVNNFMVKYQDSIPICCKIVDFQLGEYGSPLRDVIFFIYTSVQIPVVTEHYDDLIGLYHRSLVDDLVKFGCDTTPFSRGELDKEIEMVIKDFEFYHCLMMLMPIFATKEIIKELDEYSEEDMTKEVATPPKMKEKAEFLVQEFVNRNWI